MVESSSRRDLAVKKLGRILRRDVLLLVSLLAGWSLIFATATLALQRTPQQWLPVNLMSQVSADYGVDNIAVARLAPVRPQIIEAVKQDARATGDRLVATPTGAVAAVTATSTTESTLTSTPSPSAVLNTLVVSAGGPYTGNEGFPVSLSAEEGSLASDTVSYYWDLDQDGLYNDAEGLLASVVFYDEGEYIVSIQASDLIGRVATDTTTVSVNNLPPIVNVGETRHADEGQRIRLSATVSDPGHDVLFYYWDFGDGEGETGTLNPRHIYRDNGEYIVRLRAEDNDGGVTDGFFTVRVGNLPPVVDAGQDLVTREGDTVTFSGTATDPGVFDTLSYAWDLNYNGRTFIPDVFAPVVSAVYPDGPATVVAALRVIDKDDAQTIDTVNVTVGNVKPTISSVANNGPKGEGTPLSLAVTATDVGSDTLTYAFDWENDGTFDALTQSNTAAHTWYDQGSYTVGIRVDDGDGGQVFTRTTVSAYNLPPTAVAGPDVVRLEGSSIIFDGRGSRDPGIYDALTYQWNFGEGGYTANGITVTHAYADNNIYTATLTVMDNSNAKAIDTVAVTILNANPVANAGLDRTVNEGISLNLLGTASDPGAADRLSFAWDFDFDGTNFNEDATGISTSWIYGDGPATRVVAFRVRDDDFPYPTSGGGQIGETIDRLEITVNNVVPVVDAGGPYIGGERVPVTLSGKAVDVPADTLTYEWDVDDNGTFDLIGRNVITSWNDIGIYTVTLRVADDDGGIGFDTARVTIGNASPTADAGGPYVGNEGEPIVLTGTGSDPTGDPLTYTWDLDYNLIFETPGQVVTHTWPDDGVYTVTLRVEDGRGGIDTDDAVVTVNNVPPTASAGGPYITSVGIPLTLVGTGTDVPSDTLTYAWDLDYDSVFETAGRVVTNTWMFTGTYMVVLQVDDSDGGVITDTTTINVNSLYPLALLGVPFFLALGKEAIFLRKRKVYKHSHSDYRRQ